MHILQREAPFEMFWLYMGIAQIALDPPPLCQTGKCGKKCPKPSWQALTPPSKVGKNVPQAILASLYTPPPLRAIRIWKQHISKKGFPMHQGHQGNQK